MLPQGTTTSQRMLVVLSIEHTSTFWGASYALLGFHYPAKTLACELVQAVESICHFDTLQDVELLALTIS
jgi:hypothetical protein